MDEPTNHVDIAGQEQLEAEILEHGASCILVSHDRSFVRNIGTRFFEINGSKLIEVDEPGGLLRRRWPQTPGTSAGATRLWTLIRRCISVNGSTVL